MWLCKSYIDELLYSVMKMQIFLTKVLLGAFSDLKEETRSIIAARFDLVATKQTVIDFI